MILRHIVEIVETFGRIFYADVPSLLEKMRNQLIIFVILFFASCGEDHSQSKYLRWVGDSKFDAKIDTNQFKLCNSEYSVKQYFHFDQGLRYIGTKSKLKATFNQEYIPVESNQSGLIRIRFIVNCKGETGRFRLLSGDLNYEDQIFDKKITSQLLKITQSLNGWELQSIRGKSRDYYQYLIFKINKGQLVDIMP